MKPLIVALEMGYGHLRAGLPLSDALAVPLYEADRPPLSDATEQTMWHRARKLYEIACRVSQLPTFGAPLRSIVESITAIEPLHPRRDLSTPTSAVKALEYFRQRGLGRGMIDKLSTDGVPLLTTFFAPALFASGAGQAAVYCVVTDSDVARAWVAPDPQKNHIFYFAPSRRVVERLRAYGVPPDQIELTGFPLPPELLGGASLETLRRNLAARLSRLDRNRRFTKKYAHELEHHLQLALPHDERAPLVTFAVGGAGAQAELAEKFLPSLKSLLESGQLRLTLVAGVRAEVDDIFRRALRKCSLETELGRSVQILLRPNFEAYYRAFNQLLAKTDLLWTKPSELAFYAGLGLPLLLSTPVGVHEVYNRRWVLEEGAGLAVERPQVVGEFISERLHSGLLAARAWAGFRHLPKRGVYRIVNHFLPEAERLPVGGIET